METSTDPIAYVDSARVLVEIPPERMPPLDADERVPILRLDDESAAQQALSAGEIQGYYVVAGDYFTSGDVRLVYMDREPSSLAQRTFRDFLQANLVRDLPADVARRLTEGAEFILPQADGSRQPMDFSLFLNAFMPAILGFAFIIAIFTTSGYLMQAVVEEKENRTMEVLVTSLSPGKLIAGKIVGISLVGLTQIGVWTAILLTALVAASTQFAWLGNLHLSADIFWILLTVMVPAYVMFGAFMVAIGATVAEASEGQQVTGFITLPAMIPFWFLPFFLENPDSPLALALSFFPLTAPVTVSIRAGVGEVIGWQLALSSAILVICAAGSMWLAGRAFGLGLLLYGKRLPWRQLFGLKGGAA
jgi:ABC-2 type transport system permease protein